ncbi:hypothetical protein BDZ94DRAFT_1155062 [Collybia nuda]|uniref:C2H2-type domain-containing protein n=1 Tax=Collybia nuda TaxID=64659 RepID=A0A9P6CIQ0_9AGAR|nr:hypothetical protein BDZ94DRAFT_1155062 [Collybia nuda]
MDSPSLTTHSVSHVGNPIPNIPPSSSSATSSSDLPTKKKKSKMHECEICGKQFPRPSGLRTHMNTHNNVKPYPCVFPGCSRAFAVRSNATRHLRTHGAIPVTPHPTSTPYVVHFNTPTVVPPSSSSPSTVNHEMASVPYHVRWMPPSLTSRTNAGALTSISDVEYDSDDTLEVSESIDWRSALSIPLPPIIPFSCTSDTNALEERNSYLDAKPYPYHPLQVCLSQ